MTTRKPGEIGTITIRIPRIPPRDAFPRAFEGHSHWARSGIKAAMKLEMKCEVLNQVAGDIQAGLALGLPYTKAHITWTFRSRRGNYDGDNALAACKGWLDGLVEAGVLVNDTISRVSHTVKWERTRTEETVIEVKEVPDAHS